MKLPRVFRLPSTARRVRDELDAELRFHLEGRVDDLMEREGLSRDAAAREARRRFGDIDDYRRQARLIDDTMLHRRRRMERIDVIRREIRHAARALRHAPSFSLIAILTLALGLGAATAIFTLLDRVVLRPLPYPNAARLIHVGTIWRTASGHDEYAISKGQYFYFKTNAASLADLALYDGDVVVVAGDGSHPAERVTTVPVSANIFSILGIRPELGHLFGAEAELPRVATLALISHGYWQRRFGGDPAVVGKRIDVGMPQTIEIAGVLPPSAILPDIKPDIWLPNHLDPNEPPQNNHTHHAIGLLRPGVSVDAAAADVERVQHQLERDYPNIYDAEFLKRTSFVTHVTSLRDAVVSGEVVRAFWLLFGAVAFVLLIAAANVANLFLVRIDARRREVAVRTALGARRADLAAHYLAESMLLSTIAAIGAVALSYALLHIVLAVAPSSLPRLDEVTLDGASIAFCVVVALAFGVVFGLLPLGSAGLDIAVLRDGGRGLTTSRSRELARRTLVLTQLALAVVLLSGAALMAKSFARLRNVRPGFDPTGVETMMLILPPSHYSSSRQTTPFWHGLIRRVEALPGVTRAGATDNLPLAGGFGCTSVVTDSPLSDPNGVHCMSVVSVTPGYFEAMGIKVNGTLPTWSDVEAGTGPVIVSGVVAKRFWSAANPIGHSVKPFNARMPSFPVVGVAEDMRGNGLKNPLVDAIYFPVVAPDNDATRSSPGWWTNSSMTLVVRAPNANLVALVSAIREIVRQMDPQVPIADVQSMEVVVARSTADTTFTMGLLLIAATIAMALSAVGIYGVISYVVGQRRTEIGIRIALGAQIREVSSLIVGQSMRLAVAGVAIGLVAALAGTRFLGSLLFEVSPTDPFALAGTAAILLVVAAAASLGPTRRAANIDPVETMRG